MTWICWGCPLDLRNLDVPSCTLEKQLIYLVVRRERFRASGSGPFHGSVASDEPKGLHWSPGREQSCRAYGSIISSVMFFSEAASNSRQFAVPPEIILWTDNTNREKNATIFLNLCLLVARSMFMKLVPVCGLKLPRNLNLDHIMRLVPVCRLIRTAS